MASTKSSSRKPPPVSTRADDQGSGSDSSSEDGGVDGDSLESEASPSGQDGDNDLSDSDSSSVSSGVESVPEKPHRPAMLTPLSIKAMSESAGGPLPDNTLVAVANLAMNELRRVVMIANQLRKHHQSPGLSVEHFCMAEKLVGEQSFGHKTPYVLPEFKHVGKGVVVSDDSKLIDVIGTAKHANENLPRLVPVAPLTLSHHQLPTVTLPHSPVVADPADVHVHYHTGLGLDDDDRSDDDVEPEFLTTTRAISCPSIFTSAVGLERYIEKILVFNEESDIADEEGSSYEEIQPCVVVGIEWIDYMKVFLATFFSRRDAHAHGRPNTTYDQAIQGPLENARDSSDFHSLIHDISANGIFPVLGIVTNFFNDYLNHKFGPSDIEGFGRILAVIQATLQCSSIRTETIYLHKLEKTLINVISSSPPMELHTKIAQIFKLLIIKGDKGFATEISLWAGEYVTTCLNSALTSCLHTVSSTWLLLNLALSLAVGLEQIGLHLAATLGWNKAVLEVLQALESLRNFRSHLSHSETSMSSPGPMTDRDLTGFQVPSILEQSLLAFIRVVHEHHAESLEKGEIQGIYTAALELFGEKCIPYVTPTWVPDFPNGSVRKPRKRGFLKVRYVNWNSNLVVVAKRA